ncbi:hypothetical protein FA95DRAFT_1019814 [Auriscalpium vulgare]|uniref:Uncharacterized protein n=1 Tax=Auriscalpium vulgare TaxID=40419 RepID=A0ACB8R612_9AGAM|nr:hypothetical protein FA95DRAFT_1019814 [Auriscalpium vulgare]
MRSTVAMERTSWSDGQLEPEVRRILAPVHPYDTDQTDSSSPRSTIVQFRALVCPRPRHCTEPRPSRQDGSAISVGVAVLPSPHPPSPKQESTSEYTNTFPHRSAMTLQNGVAHKENRSVAAADGQLRCVTRMCCFHVPQESPSAPPQLGIMPDEIWHKITTSTRQMR